MRKIAMLSHIKIEEQKAEEYVETLSSIVNFVEQINAIDTGNLKPMFHPLDLFQRLRKDEPIDERERELFQSVAPKVDRGVYIVPKVIES